MVFYITKYALTGGIIELNSDTLDGYKVQDGRLYCSDRKRPPFSYVPGEWYTDRTFAVKDAERRKQKRLESLKKQIQKLEAMTFE